MLQRHLFRLSSAAVLSGLLTCAQAVELGDTLVRSHLGQPLSADIELTGMASDAATIQAGLASPDVYRGASIAMHPALSALNITVVRRDGRRYLHIASPKTVDSEFINIFFELTENGRRSVRQTTLWFTPDPNPPAPPIIVAPLPPPPLPVKTPDAPRALPAPVAAPLPRPAPIARPVVHAPQFTAAQIATCTAIDAKNAALSGQIVDLEEKVRRLTLAMQAGAVAAAPPVVVAKAAPARRTLLRPMGVPPEKPAAKTPWLFIGIASAAILALVGVLFYFLQRKRKGARVRPARRGPGLIASVKNRLMPAKKAGTDAPVEADPVVG